MTCQKLVILLLLCYSQYANSSRLDPITEPITDLYCKIFECCNKKTVPYRLQSLQTMLKTKLYGQHIAAEVVLNAVNSHARNPRPKQPLVMSFHGTNGGGKSYVTKMIAKAFYETGENSNYFHFYYGLENFAFRDENKISEYQMQLKNDIEASINKCERSLFILDGVDYMPPGLLDAIMPFIDCPNCANKVQKNKSIFILLSNTGSGAIVKKLLQEMGNQTEMWRMKRESLRLKDFEQIIISEVLSDPGPFYESKLIKSDAITFYVPFLPLEKGHVEKCIEEAFEELNVPPTKKLVSEALLELRFGPEPYKPFSISGCKRVEQIVGRINARMNSQFNDFFSEDKKSNQEL